MNWIAVCRVDDVDEEDVIGVAHDGHDYAVHRSPEGRFHATDGRCTHEQVLLCDGLVLEHVIECPKHNGRFDYRTGAAKAAPAVVDIRTYPTKVEAGTVYIGVDG